uniref:SpoIID/LytB domain-containing protein n=1 Tax=Desertifilum tharense IPPAS B-1220 TaxID=1781255 RepID=A0ACD5GY51_9CYAN
MDWRSLVSRTHPISVPLLKASRTVNYVDLEKYLYSVLGGEMPPSWYSRSLKSPSCARPFLCPPPARKNPQ